MAPDHNDTQLEEQIAQWRTFLRRRQAIPAPDVEELEGHLRDQVTALVDAGLAADEAFLVAVKRMGNLDALSREFVREHSERLWKQLVVAPAAVGDSDRAARSEAVVAVCLAAVAALAIKVPALFGWPMVPDAELDVFYPRNVTFFVLPLLAGYFVWKRRFHLSRAWWLALPFVAAAAVVNAYPFTDGSDTGRLAVLHLPIALWLVVGVAYVGGRWWEGSERMGFVRFSGELFIYYVLIALGGGVLTAFTVGIFESIGIDSGVLAFAWLVPCGAMGAVIIGSWLVETKQSVVENMAPVLTRIFTPLFTLLLLAFLGTMAWTGNPIDVERDILIAFDVLLVLVVGLLLYAVSARDPAAPPDLFDQLQFLLVVSALIVDVLALAAIAERITDFFGLTPNRVAALGENIVLLVGLAWSAWPYARFLRGRGEFDALARWQTAYLPVYSVWAALVVIVFPPVFSFA